ncbi:MAG: prephenate dehydrogenase/arogenate dehydrogenase family protein [Patescibacteria group bacterium]|nr:prephenate dehydrogenase/arogenate dehydrogenase family protein [Patescibacteria group bacterium]
MKKNLEIGIIGINGKYGKWLKSFFRELGYEVIGSDIQTKKTNEEVVKESDVVVFSVWPRVTVQVIEDVLPLSRKDQLWIDITSLKSRSSDALKKSHSSVAGLHPMCAPSVKNFRGQTVIFCPIRISKDWEKWILSILNNSQAIIKVTDPITHDKFMIYVQALPHISYLIMASIIRKMDIDILESLSYTSPIYRIGLDLIGRILAQDPSLYADIQMLNPNVKELMKAYAKEVKNYEEIINGKNIDKFISEFHLNENHFGKKNIQESYQYFEKIIKLLTDLTEENSIIIKAKEDKPGILKQIADIFNKHGINLVSFHSFKKDDGYEFHIGIDRSKNDKDIKNVIKKINEIFY